MTRYEIRIDELVLRGVPREHADGLAERLEQELHRLALGEAADRLTDHTEAVLRPRVAASPVGDADGLAGRTAAAVWTAVTGAAPAPGGPR